LGFPFDGEFGKNELKESLRVAFRERTDTGKGQGKRKGEPMNAKKTKKKTKTTERRDPEAMWRASTTRGQRLRMGIIRFGTTSTTTTREKQLEETPRVTTLRMETRLGMRRWVVQ